MRKKDQEKIKEPADLVKSLLKETKENQLLENPIYRIHKEIGFPTLSNEKQAELLLTNSIKIINELTPGFEATYVPVELYREYVKMTKSIFRDFFIKSNYIKGNQLLYEKFPRSDGDWIVEKKGGKFEFIYQERGAIFSRDKFETKDELIDYLINIIYKRYNLE